MVLHPNIIRQIGRIPCISDQLSCGRESETWYRKSNGRHWALEFSQDGKVSFLSIQISKRMFPHSHHVYTVRTITVKMYTTVERNTILNLLQ